MTTLHRLLLASLALTLACGGLPEPPDTTNNPPDYLGAALVGERRTAGPEPLAERCASPASQRLCEALLKPTKPIVSAGVETNCYCTWKQSAQGLDFYWGHKKVTLTEKSEWTNTSTPLYLAVDKHPTAVVKQLLAAGAHPDLVQVPSLRGTKKPSILHRPLSSAIESNNVDTARVLLEAGASLDLVEVHAPGVATIIFLLQNGAPQSQLPAPRRVTSHGAKALATVGFPLDKRNADGQAMLHWAAREGKVEVLRTLLEEGADPNTRASDGRTPLHHACSPGSAPADKLEAVGLLIEAGADVTATTNKGLTPRDVAERFSLGEVGAALEGNGG